MRILGAASAIWGFIGICTLLSSAIYRLFSRAKEALDMGLNTAQWITLIVFALFMLVCEGYRGFQKKFSPRTAARIKYLFDNPTLLHGLLAPFFCMGYFYAKRKTQLTAIILTTGVIMLILLVRFSPQPWRGIIDFGVVLGLSWGLISFMLFTFQALTNKNYPHSPETPENKTN